MRSSRLFRAIVVASVAATLPAIAPAQIVISANIAPPPLPVYVQPVAPGDGFYWTPGYWAYGPDGYYWIPGVWVRPPRTGFLWTPPYWGFAGGLYGFHAGYWGPRVGYYGGIDYGYGYGGYGYGGGRWQGGAFAYNTAVSNVNVNVVRNTYAENVTQNVSTARPSFNGGPGGVRAQPTAEEARAPHEQHLGATADQRQHGQAAEQNHAQYASANGGRPETLSMPSARSGFGHADEVNSRQGNQQARIADGTRDGQITPGEENNLQHRENRISQDVRTERAADGGALSNRERRQIDRRQNRASRAIAADTHNANNDAAAAARQGTTPRQERRQAQQERRQERPHGPEHEQRR